MLSSPHGRAVNLFAVRHWSRPIPLSSARNAENVTKVSSCHSCRLCAGGRSGLQRQVSCGGSDFRYTWTHRLWLNRWLYLCLPVFPVAALAGFLFVSFFVSFSFLSPPLVAFLSISKDVKEKKKALFWQICLLLSVIFGSEGCFLLSADLLPLSPFKVFCCEGTWLII